MMLRSSLSPLTKPDRHSPRSILNFSLHIMVLAASLLLITMISYDTFHNVSFISDARFMRLQTWICMFFLFDIAVDFCLSKHKLRYLAANSLFIIVSIPYSWIITKFDIHLPAQIMFGLRFIPLIRAAYVLVLVSRFITSDRITSIFTTYLTILLTTAYIASLIFYVEEHFVNPGVDTFWSALWWCAMELTTTNSSINAVTPVGKILSGILASEGLILFPVFTVYITSSLAKNSSKSTKNS